jgi:hypothetical protein
MRSAEERVIRHCYAERFKVSDLAKNAPSKKTANLEIFVDRLSHFKHLNFLMIDNRYYLTHESKFPPNRSQLIK